MKRFAVTAAALLFVACIAAWIGWVYQGSVIPSIPASMSPVNGTVIEYWPNGQERSERVYREGQVQEAIYYSSNGQVVFEMSSDDA